MWCIYGVVDVLIRRSLRSEERSAKVEPLLKISRVGNWFILCIHGGSICLNSEVKYSVFLLVKVILEITSESWKKDFSTLKRSFIQSSKYIFICLVELVTMDGLTIYFENKDEMTQMI